MHSFGLAGTYYLVPIVALLRFLGCIHTSGRTCFTNHGGLSVRLVLFTVYFTRCLIIFQFFIHPPVFAQSTLTKYHASLLQFQIMVTELSLNTSLSLSSFNFHKYGLLIVLLDFLCDI
jgi:hypothetical protein